ncbi:MAG TPA: VOC family protein [Candidatus Angelobacter sp.]|nr:VOC family protein [Candidatus Angelobacter sp.]
MDFYTTAPEATDHFNTVELGLESFPPVEPGQLRRYKIGSQWVGYSPLPDSASINRLNHVAFRTADCAALRAYLQANGIKVPDSLTTLKTRERSFRIQDPEGHTLEFVQPTGGTLVKLHVLGGPNEAMPDPISRHMIHAGFVVQDRAAEDHFYRDILGFHLYWQGGMQTGKNDWVAMQVPDGTDWLEYMLNVESNADQHTMGVMNHISLGVKDIKQAQATLEQRGWKPHGDEKAQMGRDGKWQLNLYDPDFTRIELMEFKPVEKPCCSEFQGKHPSD